jgi:hypothetical protein
LNLGKHIYEYDTVIIGGSLRALLYSYMSGLPCIYTHLKPPFRFDALAPDQEFKKIGLSTRNHREAFERLVMVQGTSGQLLTGASATSLNINDNTLKVTTPHSRLARFSFEKLIILCDEDIYGLPPIEKEVIHPSRVIDWLHCRSGMEHAFDYLPGSDDFVQDVYFYPSDRFGVQTSSRVRKDVVSVSHLTPSQLQEFEYSETMARHKVTQIMKDAGIKGARNGRDTKNPSLYRYYSVKLESAERVIESHVHNHYSKDDRFEFPTWTIEQIMENIAFSPNPYSLKINNKFLDF